MHLQFDKKALQDSRILSREWYLPNGTGGYTGTTVEGRHTRRYHGLLVAALEPPVDRHVMLSGMEEFLIDGRGGVFRLSCPVDDSAVAMKVPGTSSFSSSSQRRVHGGSGAAAGGRNAMIIEDPEVLSGLLDGAIQAALVSFTGSPFPTWTYDCDGLTIEKELFSVTGQNTICLIYRLLNAAVGEEEAQMVLRPLVACRPHDSLLHPATPNAQVQIEHQGGGIIRLGVAEGGPNFYLSSLMEFHASAPVRFAGNKLENAGAADNGAARSGAGGSGKRPLSFWTGPVSYPADSDGAMGVAVVEDGPDSGTESLWCPGLLVGPVTSDFPCPVIASITPVGAMSYHALRKEEAAVQSRITGKWPTQKNGIESLVSCHRYPLARRKTSGLTVMHGYPQPADHGRTAFISSIGLCLIPGEQDQFRNIITTMCDATSKGMLPDRFPERGGLSSGGSGITSPTDGAGAEPSYVHADTGLWLFHAVFKYLQFTDDFEFIKRSVYWTLVEVLGHYQRGTRGIRMDRGDALLVCEDMGYPMTWMDGIAADGKPATPRVGKPVEVNALWYNALATMEWISSKLGRSDLMRTYRGLAIRVRESFTRTFWNPRNRCLYDCVSFDGADASIRPNQILAVSLPNRLLTGDRELDVLSVVEKELLTPYGLRTLSARDPAYVGRCLPQTVGTRGGGVAGSGAVSSREAAATAAQVDQVKHQGAVWPWLLGPFLDAQARLHGAEAGFNERAESWLKALIEYQAGPGMGGIPEFFDGDEPHHPRGIPFSTLNLAETIRGYVEQIQEYPSFNIRAAR